MYVIIAYDAWNQEVNHVFGPYETESAANEDSNALNDIYVKANNPGQSSSMSFEVIYVQEVDLEAEKLLLSGDELTDEQQNRIDNYFH